MAEEYADTSEELAVSYFTEMYDITESCYQKIKDYAVVHYLVSNLTVTAMKSKAMSNQEAHCAHAGESTNKHYAQLFAERGKYVQSVALEYAEHTDIPLEQLLEKHGRSRKEYWIMLKEAMCGARSCRVTTEVTKQIQIRMLRESVDDEQCARISRLFAEVWENRSPGESSP